MGVPTHLVDLGGLRGVAVLRCQERARLIGADGDGRKIKRTQPPPDLGEHRAVPAVQNCASHWEFAICWIRYRMDGANTNCVTPAPTPSSAEYRSNQGAVSIESPRWKRRTPPGVAGEEEVVAWATHRPAAPKADLFLPRHPHAPVLQRHQQLSTSLTALMHGKEIDRCNT